MNKLRHYFVTMMALIAISSQAQVTPTSQMEKLNRGLVAVPTSTTTCFVSWRFLGTDSEDTRFDVLRNGVTIATDLQVTNYTDKNASSEADYQVVTKVNGEVKETSEAIKSLSSGIQAIHRTTPIVARPTTSISTATSSTAPNSGGLTSA